MRFPFRWTALLRRRAALLLRSLPLREQTVTIVLAVLVGVMGGYGAVGFMLLIQGVQDLVLRPFGLHGDELHLLEAVELLPFWALLLIPALGGLLVGWISTLAPETRGHGVPEVMEAMALRGGKIRGRVVVIKTIASALTIGTGGSVGREGPIVQIGAALGSGFGFTIGASSMRMRRLAACGAAAGIAAVFNAPIAGAIFSLEIILGDFTIASFAPIVLASAAATVVSRAHLGPYPTFEIPEYVLASGLDFVTFPMLGVLGGLAAVLFIRLLYFSEDRWHDLSMPEWLKAAFGGGILGFGLLFLPHLWGGGYQVMTEAMLGRLPGQLMLILVFAKIVASSLTLGSGGSGGVFAPSLFVGCMLGGACGRGLLHLAPGLTAPSGAYALIGMGAVVAGTTQAPITAIMILFELTDSYSLILPSMAACILASTTSRWLQRDSIYAFRLRRKGIVLEGGRERRILESVRVRRIMSRRVTTIPSDMPLDEVRDVVTHGRFQYYPVVDESERLLGILSLNHVQTMFLERPEEARNAVARDLMLADVVTLYSYDSLYDAMRRFAAVDVEQLPVVSDPEDRIVVGILSRGDIIRVYNREVLREEFH